MTHPTSNEQLLQWLKTSARIRRDNDGDDSYAASQLDMAAGQIDSLTTRLTQTAAEIERLTRLNEGLTHDFNTLLVSGSKVESGRDRLHAALKRIAQRHEPTFKHTYKMGTAPDSAYEMASAALSDDSPAAPHLGDHTQGYCTHIPSCADLEACRSWLAARGDSLARSSDMILMVDELLKRRRADETTVTWAQYVRVRTALNFLYGQAKLILHENQPPLSTNLAHYYAEAEEALQTTPALSHNDYQIAHELLDVHAICDERDSLRTSLQVVEELLRTAPIHHYGETYQQWAKKRDAHFAGSSEETTETFRQGIDRVRRELRELKQPVPDETLDRTKPDLSQKAPECLCAMKLDGSIIETHLACPIHGTLTQNGKGDPT